MRILFVITGLGVGGAERQVVDLADRMAGRGHEVGIAYLTGEAALLPANGSIRVTGFGISKSVGGLFRAYGSLRRLIGSFRPDVVHSHMVHANLLARLVRLTTKVPRLICTAHNTDEGGPARMWAYRLTGRLADLSTNVSAKAVAAFEAKGAVRRGAMIVVSNGIDTDRFRPLADAGAGRTLRDRAGLDPADKLVLAVGRLEVQKDYPNLLEAFARVRRDGVDARLWIAGGGPLQAGLTRAAADLGVLDRIDFLGVRPDVPALFDAADVFVLPSAWEGFSLVVGEAMACGKVVVATDCGAVRELLGDCGFLVPPRDPAALASALSRALSVPPEDASAMGARARQRIVSHFSLECAVEDWLSIYAGRRTARLSDAREEGEDRCPDC